MNTPARLSLAIAVTALMSLGTATPALALQNQSNVTTLAQAFPGEDLVLNILGGFFHILGGFLRIGGNNGINGPQISSISTLAPDQSATITWTTNEPASSVVQYGSTTSYGSSVSNSTATTSHSLIITGLATSTTYHFIVSSTDASQNTSTSSDQTVTTSDTELPINAAGWTVVTPTLGTGSCSSGTYTGTCIIYVDDTPGQGNDSTCAPQLPPVTQTPTAGTQCATLREAETKLRNNSSDWILVKDGTTYSSANPASVTAGFGYIQLTGKSATAPIVISTYGTGARPLVEMANNDVDGSCLRAQGNATYVSNFAIMGLSFYSFQRDETNPSNFVASTLSSDGNTCISILTTAQNLLIENNNFSYFPGAIVVESAGNTVTLRRNVVANSWGLNTGGNGIFIQTPGAENASGTPFPNLLSGFTMFENTLITNGGNPTLAAPENLTYTSGANATFTWPSTVFFVNGDYISCNAAQDGIPKNTSLYVENLSGSTFNLATTSNGTALTTTNSGTISCYWSQADFTEFAHSVYVHDNAPFTTLPPDTAYGNVDIDNSAGWQWRNGGDINNNFFALDGYGPQSFAPAGYPGGSYTNRNNVMTQMIAGGDSTAAAGEIGWGIQSEIGDPENWYQIGIGGTATAGDTLNITFTNSGIAGSPVTVSYTVQSGDSTTAMAAGLVAAINSNSALASFGITANHTSSEGSYVVDIVGAGQPGFVTFGTSVTGAGTESMVLNLNEVGPMSITNNLAFDYSNPATGGVSTQNPQSGIALQGVVGATVSGNTVCNWGPTPIEDLSYNYVGGVVSGPGGAAELQVPNDSGMFEWTGQGPVQITGVNGATYVNTGVGSSTLAKYISNDQLLLPNIPYQAGSPFTSSPSSIVTLYPVQTNTWTGNYIGSGVGNNDCSGLGFSNAPNWTPGSYLQAIGLGPQCAVPNACTTQDFINFEEAQSESNWNPQLEACAVNDWFRTKFGMPTQGCAD